ncbi:hypothetical protein UlMin_008349 [Ulmus minor]
MDNLVLKQKRVKFSSPGRDRQEESDVIRGRESSKDGKEKRGLDRWYFSSQTSQDHESIDSDFATAVAAAAFAVHSLDQAEQQFQMRMREALEASRTKAKSRKDEITTDMASSGRGTRLFSNKEAKTGEHSRRRSLGQELMASERASPARQPSRTSSVWLSQTQKGMPPGQNGVETKADAWEKAKLERVQSGYEKKKSTILEWENEKKMQAKLKMDRTKSILEQQRAASMKHYQHKIERIEQIAGGARTQLEEKRRNKESAVKEKAKKVRSTGKVPVRCFCFSC